MTLACLGLTVRVKGQNAVGTTTSEGSSDVACVVNWLSDHNVFVSVNTVAVHLVSYCCD